MFHIDAQNFYLIRIRWVVTFLFCKKVFARYNRRGCNKKVKTQWRTTKTSFIPQNYTSNTQKVYCTMGGVLFHHVPDEEKKKSSTIGRKVVNLAIWIGSKFWAQIWKRNWISFRNADLIFQKKSQKNEYFYDWHFFSKHTSINVEKR